VSSEHASGAFPTLKPKVDLIVLDEFPAVGLFEPLADCSAETSISFQETRGGVLYQG